MVGGGQLGRLEKVRGVEGGAFKTGGGGVEETARNDCCNYGYI